jgi:hypothetical protein
MPAIENDQRFIEFEEKLRLGQTLEVSVPAAGAGFAQTGNAE